MLVKLVAALILQSLILVSCSSSHESENQTSNRPDCVSLASYSGVIEQVVDMEPEWESIYRVGEESEYKWAIKDKQSDNTLTAILSSAGCVCATRAESHQIANFQKSELGGLILGAAAAPVSDFNYTADWLEPKILASCLPSLLLKSSYSDEKTFDDKTTWKFTCYKMPGIGEAMYQLTILTPRCENVFP